ncbi:hypothetical protein H5410_038022 [Solanum commersonii]|uniref:Uncharacterized protein n=1 Tax=Solanum commersonii TaxID=4109 RepID=A0A9J5YCS2_SOLCO|nr:hypothetical protein H5410_038022 [Solanum commersonii]
MQNPAKNQPTPFYFLSNVNKEDPDAAVQNVKAAAVERQNSRKSKGLPSPNRSSPAYHPDFVGFELNSCANKQFFGRRLCSSVSVHCPKRLLPFVHHIASI